MTITEAKRAATEYVRVEGESTEIESHLTELYAALMDEDLDKLADVLEDGSGK